ncbi:insulinase family protein [Mucilaginibacter sp. ZT4R22]|uniref:Insulinase family protein n=2 Tax=Mucilaginibacter pankratovii TaxID=2772110 RepID=A0ABR7WMS4_9SPHI|nr:insulinase family protein [Mucilaginibacter pankratovii]
MSSLLLCTYAAVATAQSSEIPLDAAVRTGKLKNGFTYYIRHNATPKNRAQFYLVNKVGSVLENDDQLGLAHFVEHMTFNGSRNFPKNTMMNYLQTAGVRFGADVNAYTGYDETVYQLPLPTDSKELVDKGLQIVHDWAQSATLDPVEIDKERGVILEEKRLGKGASDRLQQQYYPLLFNHSRYAARNPIGTDAILKSFKPAIIKQFYHDWYRPDLQALIIVGDIDAAAMEKKVKALFDDLKNPVAKKKRVAYAIPLTGKNQFIALTDKETTSTTAEIVIKHKAPVMSTTADYKGLLTRQLFNSMIASRFAELSRQPDPDYLSANSGIRDFLGGLDTYRATVVVKPGELKKGFMAMWYETERLRALGFSADELDRAKQNLKEQMENIYREKDKNPSGNYVQEYLSHFLKNEAAPGIEGEYKLMNRYLPLIQLDDMNTLIGSYLKDNNRDMIITAPADAQKDLPNQAEMERWIAEVRSMPVQAFSVQKLSSALLAAEPVAGKVVTEVTDSKEGITTLTLSNGVKIIIKPTTFKNNQIIFRGFSPGGTSLYEDKDYPSAANAASIIAAAGVGNLNATELDRFVADKELEVRPYIAERFQGITGGSSVKDFEVAMSLVYAYLTQPQKDSSLYKTMMERSRARYDKRANDPGSVFNDTVSAVLGNKNIRRTGPSIKKLDMVNLDRAYQIYKERFSNAGNMTFVFTGSIDIAAAKPVFEKYLGSLPRTPIADKARDLDIDIPAGSISKTVYKGREAKASVLLVYSGKYDYNDRNNILFDALRETLNIRLLETLREQESGVYSPRVELSTTQYPKGRFSLTIQFGCAPANVDKLIATAKAEVTALANNGPRPEIIRKWQAEWVRQRELDVNENAWWLSYLVEKLQSGGKLDGYANDLIIVKETTPAAIQDIAHQQLLNGNLIKMILVPEQ